ncbi:MAG: hypothetical protein K5905_27460 [Roseibium sp.]|uniref:nuclear transport factor 2 family protein n=1 Tax=Roseibium sp. TaxID=1936156 RepID=UPI0026226288|nr:hypothetical protein [Roseibium sp.]MCV0429205.1 hypothetical protein [Roseibium sp.]
MTNDAKTREIRETIDSLITAGTTADLNGLNAIYHDDMKTHMIDTDGNLAQADKPAFIAMLKELIEGSAGIDNTWAEYNAIEAEGEKGHVLITRKVTLGGEARILVLSIDLVFEDARWQVVREVIFSRPNSELTVH